MKSERFTVTFEGESPSTSETPFTFCTPAEWFSHLAEGRHSGHTLYAADDPRSRNIGFVNDNTNHVYYLGISKIRSSTEEDTLPMIEFGLTHSDIMGMMSTHQGRSDLLGSHQDFFSLVSPSPEGTDPNVDLSSLWTQDSAEFLSYDYPDSPDKSHHKTKSPIAGWSRIVYPRDIDLVPMVDSNGSRVSLEFSGYYKRFSDHVVIIPDGGVGFKAKMSDWSMTDEDLSKIGGYVVPDGVDVSNTGVEFDSQVSLLTGQ